MKNVGQSIVAATLALSAMLICAAPKCLGQSPVLPGWRLVWSDEFPGTTFDPTKWNAENVAWPYNAELEYYLPEQATAGNGLLNIKAERRNFGGRNYVSARLNTSGKWVQQYGRFEARMKLPIGQGYWPAFWLLPATQLWPPEIDIMELIGSQPTKIYMTHHWGTPSNVMSNGITYFGADYTAGYHRFAVEWSPNKVDWFIDGALRFTTVANFPQEPMYILLNLAIGGTLPGNPNASTVFPQSMLVDWVRVYMRDSAPLNPGFEDPAAGGALASWQTFGNASQSTISPRGGVKSLRLRGNGGGTPNYSGVFQNLPASPGQVWSTSISGLHSAADPLPAGNFVDLKIEWYNWTGAQVGVNLVTALSNTSPTNIAVPATLQATAPAGTASARVAVVMVQGGAPTGTAYMDDVTFGYSSPAARQTCAGDFNGANGVSVQDIFDFLAAYFAADPRSEFNGDLVISVQDIFDFLAIYFTACSP